jgi:hypothetical protein
MAFWKGIQNKDFLLHFSTIVSSSWLMNVEDIIDESLYI